MDKEIVVYVKWNIVQPLKKNEILPFMKAWIDPEVIMLIEISRTGKDIYHKISLICRI